MKHKQITLNEYSYIFIGEKDEGKNKAVRKEVFDELEAFVLKNSEYVQFLKIGQNKYHKFLQAQNYVGVIQTKDGTTIEILPKISNLTGDRKEQEDKSKEILIRMLQTLKNSPFKHFNMANVHTKNMPLLEIFITMFLEELAKLIQRGIKSDYITQEENLKFLKGKLLMGQQIKHNTIHKEQFYVEYQEFLSDRIENRLIKTTLEYLYKKSKSSRNQQRIREFLFVFDEVSACKEYKIGFTKVKLNRQMKDYEQVLLWCKTFLLENSFSPYKGSDVAFALLFDMNLLFESYVGHYLKKKGCEVNLQDKGKHLVETPQKFALRPDIVINKESETPTIIADTKWKMIKEEKDISQSDMYQLFAYGKKYNNQKLYLIYPDHEEKPTQDLQYSYNEGLLLEVLYFDVTQDFKSYDFKTL
jgi:5-methylcytosine-specific restriction enzyme subunit McrC